MATAMKASTAANDHTGGVDAAIVDYIAALKTGNYSAPLDPAGGPLHRALLALGESLSARTVKAAETVVETAICSNELGILAAQMIAPVRQASANAHSMSAAAREMVVAVDDIDRTSQDAARSAGEAKEAVAGSVVQVRQAVAAFQELTDMVQNAAADVAALGEASKEIGGIVRSIEQIASQTRLLALNATIEAARAGEAGKGFTVVANEVKNLALQTAHATDDIRKRIETLLGRVARIGSVMSGGVDIAEKGKESIGQLGHGIEGLGEQVDGVAHSMSDIAGILSQQSQNIHRIAEGVTAVADLNVGNEAAVDALTECCDQLEGGIGRQLSGIAEQSFPDKVVLLAKADHVIWKRRLVSMATGRTKLRADELADHRSCRLGKWYYSDAAARFAGEPSFKALEGPHERVHRHGKAAAHLFAEGRIDDALKEIAAVEDASREVVRLLDTLRG